MTSTSYKTCNASNPTPASQNRCLGFRSSLQTTAYLCPAKKTNWAPLFGWLTLKWNPSQTKGNNGHHWTVAPGLTSGRHLVVDDQAALLRDKSGPENSRSPCGWTRNPFRTNVQKPWSDDSPVNETTISGFNPGFKAVRSRIPSIHSIMPHAPLLGPGSQPSAEVLRSGSQRPHPQLFVGYKLAKISSFSDSMMALHCDRSSGLLLYIVGDGNVNEHCLQQGMGHHSFKKGQGCHIRGTGPMCQQMGQPTSVSARLSAL